MADLAKLIYTPDQGSYSLKDGNELLSAEVEGGLGRRRRDKLGSDTRIKVQWTLNPTEYQGILSFYRGIGSGYQAFHIDLIRGTDTLVEHTAHLVPGTFGLESHTGETYVVGAELDVTIPSSSNGSYFPKVTIPPDKNSYTLTVGPGAHTVKHEGGASRYGRTKRGAASIVNVKWTVGPAGYNTLRTFYEDTARGSLPFLIDLVVDEIALVECKAYLVPGTFGLDEQDGLSYTVGARLEVITPPVDEAYLESLLWVAEEPQADIIVGLLSTLVNDQLPVDAT